MRKRELSVVGCAERVELEGLELTVSCRIDTGARTSALHVLRIESSDDGDEVTFVVRGQRGTRTVRRKLRASVLRWARVRSPNGASEVRAFVLLPIQVGADRFDIEVGLTDRENMRFPMLLGRAAIAGRYLVDPSRTYIARSEARERQA